MDIPFMCNFWVDKWRKGQTVGDLRDFVTEQPGFPADIIAAKDLWLMHESAILDPSVALNDVKAGKDRGSRGTLTINVFTYKMQKVWKSLGFLQGDGDAASSFEPWCSSR